ncbi:PQQ-dependent sugar dehydrogenase [Rhodoferax sp. U2-2l]|uniref:PQQ-dependent sugar dehydrogenase n=1 Tax=Rhodoferax sp. U2-2l TaxID=2884000 RepID=UPI001D099EF8|nr:PQQ-dependent sugar dehydrogenase [Rhodoferax sp. U2-2l]MCB8746399.1 PQQ-dependent sugar dehydrogenase [Rhodoferax sp. U2-2l]
MTAKQLLVWWVCTAAGALSANAQVAPTVVAGSAPAAAGAKPQPDVVARGLAHPWGLTFIDAQRLLVTERPGRLRLVTLTGQVGPAIAGLPPIHAAGQGGLLDVLADSQFAVNRTLYFCYTEPGAGGNVSSTALASARLSDDASRLDNVRVLFSQKPKVSGNAHFGCRIVESPDGKLFLTLGDRYHRMHDAQTLDNHHGKVVRIHKDGRIPPDNPLMGQAGALPEIWSWGHRNVQGAAWGPDGALWTVEHGPQGGDELNRPQPGKNYGWPVITYGEQYGGGPIGQGLQTHPGMAQPVYQWTPSIAPSGMAFVTSARYGRAWQGSLLVGALKFRYLARLTLQGGQVAGEEKLLQDLGERIRAVRQGPDGLIYLLTDSAQGRLLRLQPR